MNKNIEYKFDLCFYVNSTKYEIFKLFYWLLILLEA